jgi:hypothetical protein
MAKDEKAIQESLSNDYDYSDTRVMDNGGARTVLSMTETVKIKEVA